MNATAAAAANPSVSERLDDTPAAIDLQADDFALFGLRPGFALDRARLDETWKQLQRQVHPDRFAAQGAAAQRVAMQWSVRINEAYSRLKDPLSRAAYWCERQGFPVNAHSNTAMHPAFLMQQMEWREALEAADDTAALDQLVAQTHRVQTELLDQLAQSIDEAGDAEQAVQQVRALMFVQRFADEVHNRLERIS